MSRDPFDEFRKIFRKMMNGDNMLMGSSGYSVSVQRVGDETRVKVRGDLPEGEIERLRQKYPDSEILVNGEKVSGSGPVEVLDEESSEDESEDMGQEGSPEVEVLEEDEIEPEQLALKRFRERNEE